MNKDVIESIESAIPVPAYIAAIANACRYDLLHGPSWLRLPAGDIQQVNDDCLATYRADLEDEMQPGDTLEETYCGKAADALRDFIDELPSEGFVEGSCVSFSTKEPEGFMDEETGEYIEPWCDDVYRVLKKEIVEALFGKTIAREFR